METKVCKKCGETLPLSMFVKRGYGYETYCRNCSHERALKRKQKKQDAKEVEIKKQVLDAQKMRLEQFDSRDLLLELKRRGYKGHFTYTKVYEVDLEKVD